MGSYYYEADDYTDYYERPYNGNIDGGGHTIAGLHINSDDICAGFVGLIADGSEVKNLTLKEVTVNAGSIDADTQNIRVTNVDEQIEQNTSGRQA